MPFVDGFLPSARAPLFGNGPWPPGADFKISIPGLPPIDINSTQMGYCGGMAFMTRDIFEAGMPQLQSTDPTTLPVPTVQYIQRRLLDSFQPVPAVPATWLAYDAAFDHDTVAFGTGTYGRSVQQAKGIMADIDQNRLCPIGMVLIRSLGPWDVFNDHVELVYGYELNGSELTLHVYDCNRPHADDIFIKLSIAEQSPAGVIATNGTPALGSPGTVRGFFRLNYQYVDPSPAYVDDAAVSVSVLPPPLLGASQQTSVTVQATNLGSTTWTAGQQYRLGSQFAQDNMTWGLNRVELPGTVPPRAVADFQFTVTAPSTAGTYDFSWQMVKERVHWFGPSTPPLHIPVGSATGVCTQLAHQWRDLKAALDDINQEISNIDWSDPQAARVEAVRLHAKATQLSNQIGSVERTQLRDGCAPGPE